MAGAQTVTQVEDFGTAPAARVKQGLGFNINPMHEWEFQLAQEAGSTYVRFDCSWPSTEKQNPDNTSGGFAMPKVCAMGLAYAKTYGQRPSLNALYGPPFHPVLTATLAADVPVGSYTLPLHINKGSLTALRPMTSEILLASGQQLTARHSYPGSLITSIDPAQSSIRLAAATSVPLPPGTSVIVNELLYAPVITTKASTVGSDQSVVAFGRYAHFLAEEIHRAGLMGEVELWNEPVWAGDPWDHGDRLFDKPPADVVDQPAIPLYVSTMQPVDGVIFDSGYTEKSGFQSIYTTQNVVKIPSIENALRTVAAESFHPYGNSPEHHFWYPDCLKKLVGTENAGGRWSDCSPPGTNAGSNGKSAVLDAMRPAAHGGPRFNVTETGACRGCYQGTTEDQITRFNMRQFIGFEGLGVSPIIFFQLADRGKANTFGWVNYDTHAPLPVFTAFKALMTDVDGIAGEPASLCSLPKVMSYKGFYPLSTVTFLGTRASKDKVNSVLFFAWQRSYPAPNPNSPWLKLSSPGSVMVQLAIPKGMNVVTVKNTVTRSGVSFEQNGTALNFQVADDPVEIAIMPSRNVRDAVPCPSLR
jgi:hypothetical protein